uniref:Uncharacterized protein n=1 Tax=Ditylenchus dipsaci TaxID=166011 RepID=A0A915DJI9_9BILA
MFSHAANAAVTSLDIAACVFLVESVDELLVNSEELNFPIENKVRAQDVNLVQKIEAFRNYRNSGKIVGLGGERKLEQVRLLYDAVGRLMLTVDIFGFYISWLVLECFHST